MLLNKVICHTQLCSFQHRPYIRVVKMGWKMKEAMDGNVDQEKSPEGGREVGLSMVDYGCICKKNSQPSYPPSKMQERNSEGK